MLEADIKHALEKHLLSCHPIGAGLNLIEELRLSGGAARADVVNVTEMHCYEIKSQKDSLRRLVSQGSRYIRVFDRITLVTDPKHLDLALSILPSWWGIMLVPETENGELTELRAAGLNSLHVPGQIAKILTKDECLEILTVEGLIKGRKSQSLYRLQQFIAETFSIQNLKSLIKEALLSRAKHATAASFDSSVLLHNQSNMMVNAL